MFSPEHHRNPPSIESG